MTRPPKTGGRGTASEKSGNHKDGGATGRAPKGGDGGPRKANRRGAARLAAVQALYQMDMTAAGLNEILAQFESHWLGREVEGEQYLPAEAAFFRDIVSGVVDAQRDLDPRINAALEATWPLKRIEAILRSVLRAGAYELEKRTDIPARVIVSEYVDVAHAFVDKTETGMVNAVLDRLARNARAAEFG
jgi:N utilization substance protein B